MKLIFYILFSILYTEGCQVISEIICKRVADKIKNLNVMYIVLKYIHLYIYVHIYTYTHIHFIVYSIYARYCFSA